MSQPRPKSGRNWGRWGEDDERGALNLLTGERILAALALPTRGTVYELAAPIQSSGVPGVSSRPMPVHLFSVDGGDYAAGGRHSHGCASAEDYLFLPIHGTSTHLDGLGHVWTDDQIYNGFSSNTVRSTGMRRCGIEHAGGIITRGVLCDLARHYGVEHLPGGYTITAQDIASTLDGDGVKLRPADAVLLRTGWSAVYARDPAEYERSWPGLGLDAAHWLAERDVVLIGADNPAVEAVPFPEGTTAPVHQFLLRDCGVYLLELLHLEEIASAGVREFLLVTAPLAIKGATGSPANPLAIV